MQVVMTDILLIVTVIIILPKNVKYIFRNTGILKQKFIQGCVSTNICVYVFWIIIIIIILQVCNKK